MSEGNGSQTVNIVRWIARISAGLTAALILIIFIGEGILEGFEPLVHLTTRETLMMIAFVAIWLGLMLGWRWKLGGALLTIGGLIAFYLLDYLFSGTFPSGPFLLLFAAPSLLFLYDGLRERKASRGAKD
jgi:hypothetical protein